ncbi:MAG TPA: AraC family transcriptional regulator [Caulobacteraceae bacterium]|nr:AraC family transcriptional regulator [Caulobacteraceae bacterium]
MSPSDWLSHLLKVVSVTGQLEVRCAYGAPWRVAWPRAAAHEIPYHVIVKGRAVIAASESEQAPTGLLSQAGHPRLAPAISAMLADPARPWNLAELADVCGMSRATFMRRFQDALGRSAADLLTDIRMSLAANELKKPEASTEAVAELVGYQSISAFRRVFADRMGMTPGDSSRPSGRRTFRRPRTPTTARRSWGSIRTPAAW